MANIFNRRNPVIIGNLVGTVLFTTILVSTSVSEASLFSQRNPDMTANLPVTSTINLVDLTYSTLDDNSVRVTGSIPGTEEGVTNVIKNVINSLPLIVIIPANPTEEQQEVIDFTLTTLDSEMSGPYTLNGTNVSVEPLFYGTSTVPQASLQLALFPIGSGALPIVMQDVRAGLDFFLVSDPGASVSARTRALYSFCPEGVDESAVTTALTARGLTESKLYLQAANNTFLDSDVAAAITILATKSVMATRDNILSKMSEALAGLLP